MHHGTNMGMGRALVQATALAGHSDATEMRPPRSPIALGTLPIGDAVMVGFPSDGILSAPACVHLLGRKGQMLSHGLS